MQIQRVNLNTNLNTKNLKYTSFVVNNNFRNNVDLSSYLKS